MITAAKLRRLAHVQHPGDYDRLKSSLQMFLPSHFPDPPPTIISLFPSVFFLFSLLIWLFVLLFSVHWFLSPLLGHLLSLFSLFQFSARLSFLLLCSFKPFAALSYFGYLSPALSLCSSWFPLVFLRPLLSLNHRGTIIIWFLDSGKIIRPASSMWRGQNENAVSECAVCLVLWFFLYKCCSH